VTEVSPEAVEAAVDAYLEAWSTTDEDRRTSLLDRSLTDDAVFSGPTGSFAGRDGVAGLIVSLRNRLGAAAVGRTGPLQPAGEGFRFAWRVQREDGSTLLEGTDEVVAATDGRLRMISMVL